MIMKRKYVLSLFLVTLLSVAIAPVIFTQTVDAASNSYEYQVLDLVNQERVKYGVAPLKMDRELFDAAKIRSNELVVKFSHTRPDGTACFTVSSKASGENIAYGQKTPQQVMNSWMNSDGHKRNILDSSYKSIGIGYLNGGTPYWVQLFGRSEADERLEDTDILIERSYEVGDGNGASRTTKASDNSGIVVTYGKGAGVESGDSSKDENNSLNTETKDGTTPVNTVDNKNEGNNGAVTTIAHVNPYKPKISSISIANNKKVVIKWNKISNANGYKIYRSTKKNGKYTLIKTINKKTSTKFIDTKVKNKKYYYKIRSYNKSNGKVKYSGFSAIKSVRAKT